MIKDDKPSFSRFMLVDINEDMIQIALKDSTWDIVSCLLTSKIL